jgi:hypothetical protein
MKQTVFLGAVLFGIIGGYVPVLFGDTNFPSGWSILGSTLGGFFGIWVGYKAYTLISGE